MLTHHNLKGLGMWELVQLCPGAYRGHKKSPILSTLASRGMQQASTELRSRDFANGIFTLGSVEVIVVRVSCARERTGVGHVVCISVNCKQVCKMPVCMI